MRQRQKTKYLLYIFVFTAFSLVLVAIFSLYFSDKTLYAKQRELALEKKYIELENKIIQKQKLYRQISDNIDKMQNLTGENEEFQNENIDEVLKRATNVIKRMVLKNIPTGFPVDSNRVTSNYGYRIHPIYKDKRFHYGIDIAGKTALAIYATADGIVRFSGYTDSGYGNLVIISHNFGFESLYGHMMKNLRVKRGEFVKKGEIIGYLGNSGLSTGPHLHYEIKYINRPIDPKYFLTANNKGFEKLLRSTPKIKWQPLINAITSSYRNFTSL